MHFEPEFSKIRSIRKFCKKYYPHYVLEKKMPFVSCIELSLAQVSVSFVNHSNLLDSHQIQLGAYS